MGDLTSIIVNVPTSWMDRAACRGRTDVFYGPPGENADAAELREAQAKLICAACPVLVHCRVYVGETGDPHGVWGGLGEHERVHSVGTRAKRCDTCGRRFAVVARAASNRRYCSSTCRNRAYKLRAS